MDLFVVAMLLSIDQKCWPSVSQVLVKIGVANAGLLANCRRILIQKLNN